MKIAILASTKGEKALYLYDFFKEGNRIEVDCLLTDNPDSEIAGEMKRLGIEVIYLSHEREMEEIRELLQNRGVELMVVDDFNGEVPPALKSLFGEAIVFPQGRESAPLEVISTTDRLKAAANAMMQQPEPSKEEEKQENQGESTGSELDREWAEVLNVDLSKPQQPDPVKPEINIPPVPPQSQVPPAYRPATPKFNPYFKNTQEYRQGENNIEPMPDTYLVWSVVFTVLCCLIPGIIAIVYSASVSSKYYAGDIEGAKRASRNAQIWCIVSVVVGVIWGTLYLPLALLL